MDIFTPMQAILGGVLLGAAALLLLGSNGRILGVSGIFGGLLHFQHGETLWRFAFVLGMIVGGGLLMMWLPDTVIVNLDYSPAAVMLAGLLVGIGSRMGSGCTSGHGICGVGRISPRSIVATVTFMFAGAAAAIVVGQLFGGRF